MRGEERLAPAMIKPHESCGRAPQKRTFPLPGPGGPPRQSYRPGGRGSVAEGSAVPPQLPHKGLGLLVLTPLAGGSGKDLVLAA